MKIATKILPRKYKIIMKFSKKVVSDANGLKTIRLEADAIVVKNCKIEAAEDGVVYLSVPEESREGLIAMDEKILAKAKKSSEAWFGREIGEAVIDAAYRPLGKAGTVKVALAKDAIIYDASDRDLDSVPPEGSTVHVALEPTSVQIAKSDLLANVELVQMKLTRAKKQPKQRVKFDIPAEPEEDSEEEYED